MYLYVHSSTVVYAWANSKEDESLQQAGNILKRMDELRESGERPDLIPDVASYTSIINALANKSRHSTAQEAEDILNHLMVERSSSLDSGIFNAVIKAHNKSGQSASAEKAEAVLRFLLDDKGPVNAKPNTITFNSVIDSWSKVGGKEGAGKSFTYLV